MQANSKHKNMEEGPSVKDRHETAGEKNMARLTGGKAGTEWPVEVGRTH